MNKIIVIQFFLIYLPHNYRMLIPKKEVCVIGAGSSGLVVMKELKTVGHNFQCFELLPYVGGVYVKSYRNTILTTSSLLTAWSDHSDGDEANPKFWSAEDYLNYLHSYAVKHNLLPYISFRHLVQSIKKCESSNKWLVTVLGGRPCKSFCRCDAFTEDTSLQPITLRFDAIAVCTGTNTFSSLPILPGMEEFKGEIIHSEEYHSPEKYIGKKVLIIGAGESGSDITYEISKVASKCAISIRGLHGHLIPRIQTNGRVTDLNTNRCRYSNPYIFGEWVGYFTQLLKYLIEKLQSRTDQSKVFSKIAEFNMLQKTSAFSKFGCKNEGFVRAIVLNNTEFHRDNFYLTNDRAIFDDGSEFICDAIVACTGYRNSFPFFLESHPDLNFAGMNPRKNYKQIFAIDYPGEIGFFGFARPAFGSIPPTAELQARLWAMVINAEIQLPSKFEMNRIADEDEKNWESRFGRDVHRIKGLVDYQIYCDMLANIMGVMPPLNELILTNPFLWLKIMCGPFTVHQYRLQGPYSNRIEAEAIICRHPFGDILETSVTLFFLILAKILFLLGFHEFKPNNF